MSFRGDTGWTQPRALAAGVNTLATENFAFYGPGGGELYFVRDFATIHWLPLDRALGPR